MRILAEVKKFLPVKCFPVTYSIVNLIDRTMSTFWILRS